MKKKILVLTFISVFALTMLTGCGNSKKSAEKSTPAETQSEQQVELDNPVSSAELTPSIKPLSGWQKQENSPFPTYMCTKESCLGANIVLTTDTVPPGVTTGENYVKFAQEILNSALKDIKFSDVTKTTVNGMEAFEYTATMSATSTGFTIRLVNVLKGSKVYTIQCTAMTSAFNGLKNDFQSMIDTFELK